MGNIVLHGRPLKAMGVQIHWFSIFNSFMMVIFLTGLVAMIMMRTLRADYARYTSRDDDDLEVRGPAFPVVGSLREGQKLSRVEVDLQHFS